MNSLLKMENARSLSILKDPFFSKMITKVSLHWSLKWDGEPYVWGHVEFRNGNTEGKQKFEAESLDHLIQQVKTFIESLRTEKS